MDEMKYDMCGAAAVLGTLRAVAHLGAKVRICRSSNPGSAICWPN